MRTEITKFPRGEWDVAVDMDSVMLEFNTDNVVAAISSVVRVGTQHYFDAISAVECIEKKLIRSHRNHLATVECQIPDGKGGTVQQTMVGANPCMTICYDILTDKDGNTLSRSRAREALRVLRAANIIIFHKKMVSDEGRWLNLYFANLQQFSTEDFNTYEDGVMNSAELAKVGRLMSQIHVSRADANALRKIAIRRQWSDITRGCEVIDFYDLFGYANSPTGQASKVDGGMLLSTIRHSLLGVAQPCNAANLRVSLNE